MSTTFQIGDRVAFSTPGKYSRERSGVITALTSAYATVKGDDGVERQARPKTLRAA